MSDYQEPVIRAAPIKLSVSCRTDPPARLRRAVRPPQPVVLTIQKAAARPQHTLQHAVAHTYPVCSTHLLCCHCVQGLEEGLKGDLARSLGLDLPQVEGGKSQWHQ